VRVLRRARSPILCLGVTALACASDPSAPADAGVDPVPIERFAGVSSGPSGETGMLDLAVPRPAAAGASPFAAGAAVSGTLLVDGVESSIPLTGDVDPTGAELRFGGTVAGPLGRFSCTAALVDGSVRGKCTGADQRVRDFDARGAAGGAVRRFCGVWTDPLLEPAGPFNVLTQGGYAAAVFNSGIISGVAVGTRSGDDLTLSIAPIGTVTGRVSGDTVSGTWTVPAIGGGNFSGRVERCPTGAGSGATDAGSVDAAMGSSDAGG
jgi:hypothetical protein